MKLKHDYLYFIAQSSGHLCLWSAATNRAESWQAFLRAAGYSSSDLSAPRKQYQQSGHRCVRVRVTLAEEGK